MKILRKRESPHIEVHVDGEARTVKHVCLNCKTIETHSGLEAFMAARDKMPAFAEAHKHQRPETAPYARLSTPLSKLIH
jgi:hypothetical protein